MVQVIESGTLKWGVKQSYRQYIFNKKLANGNWKIAGDIKEVGEKRGKDFYFEVPVDPKASNLEIKDNKIVEAEINTKDSSIVFLKGSTAPFIRNCTTPTSRPTIMRLKQV